MNMSSYNCCDNTSETSEGIQSLSALLKLVGEESRLRLLCILKDGGEHCVCEFIEHASDLSQSLISHHLADLKNAGLVASKKTGLRVYYSLTEEGAYVVRTIFKLIDIRDKKCNNKEKCGENRSCGDGVCDL